MNDKYLLEEYTARINRALDYIDANLGSKLTLRELADVANFSRFHFHRIFAAVRGETLNNYIQRVRIEKSASLLINNPKLSITEIALDCGFSGSAAFARSFKEMFGMSASEWRRQIPASKSNICKSKSNFQQKRGKKRKEFQISSVYFDSVTKNQKWRITMENEKKITTEVTVEKWPDIPVVYVRHVGPYKGDSGLFENLYSKLMSWAGPRGLLQNPGMRMFNMYHDNPEITDDDKLRLSVCLTAPAHTKVDGEIGKTVISGGKYAVGRFEIDVNQYQDAWDAMWGGWLPQSGYQPADGACLEECLNNPAEHPENKHIIHICIPVKPL